MNAKVVGLIPARWGSSRFPGKPLHPILGKPLVQHVWERVSRCSSLDAVAIATDDERIRAAAEDFGAVAIMTRNDHPSGSDRLAEAVQSFPEAEIVINIQGDEPLIDTDLINQLAEELKNDPSLEMATAACPLEDDAPGGDFGDKNVVKVVLGLSNNALYFSRSPIPFARNERKSPVYRHLGIYAYRRSFLEQFVQWMPTPLETTESLEQLRALEHGAHIRVVITSHVAPGVDTPEQALQIEKLLLSHS